MVCKKGPDAPFSRMALIKQQLIILFHVTIAAQSPADNSQTDSMPVMSRGYMLPVWIFLS